MARRVQFGTTWWGKQWIDALTHLDYENRLPRGRTYYNTGRIDDMQFNPAKLRGRGDCAWQRLLALRGCD